MAAGPWYVLSMHACHWTRRRQGASAGGGDTRRWQCRWGDVAKFFESSAVLPREQNWGMAESTPTRIVTLAGTVRFVVFSAILLSSLYGITIATGIHPRVPLTALAIVRVTTWRGLAACQWLPTMPRNTAQCAAPFSACFARCRWGLLKSLHCLCLRTHANYVLKHLAQPEGSPEPFGVPRGGGLGNAFRTSGPSGRVGR